MKPDPVVGNEPEWLSRFDFWTDDDHADDPYPHYAELRERCPVAHSDALGGYWLCTNYDDIHAVLQDARTFSSRYITVPDHPEPAGPRVPLQLDPPEHGKFRLALAPIFTPAAAKALEPVARAIAVELLEPIAERGGGEFVHELAAPLPQRLLLGWLGFPPEGVEYLARLDEEAIRQNIATHEGSHPERSAKEAADPISPKW
jgi:cytochrome P450